MAEQRVSLVLSVTGQQAFEKAAKSVNKVEQAASKISPTGGKVSKALNNMGSASAQAGQRLNGLQSNIGSLIAKLAALSATAVGVGSSINAAFARENAEKRLQNLTSSTAEYEQSLRLAKIASEDFGVTQTEATQALGDTLSRLKGVGFGLTEVNEIYTGFNVIAKQSGVAAEDAAGAFLQLGQALGSGKLQGDELRAILERMPQLAQAIADEMGIAAGEVRQAGADGKITGEIMYAALQKAANAAGDLNGKLTENQLTTQQVKQKTEELQVALGKTLAPIYLQVLEAMSGAATVLANAFNKLNRYVEENRELLTAVLKVGLEIGKLAGAIFVVVKAYATWQKAVAAVAAAKAFLVSLSGKGLALVAAGVAATAATYAVLGGAVDGVVKEVEELEAKSKKELEATRKKVKENEDQFRGLTKATKEQIVVIQQLTAEQKNVTEAIKGSTAELEKQKGLSQLGQQRLKTEMAINSVLLKQAKTQLDSAKTAGERKKAADKIYKLTIQQAKLEKEMADNAVAESVRKQQAQVALLELKEREVQIARALADANGDNVDKYDKALKIASDSVAAAKEQLDIVKAIAQEQYKENEALFKGKELAAKTALEQNKVFKATQNAAASAQSFGSEMATAAGQTERAAGAMERLGKAQAAASSAAGMQMPSYKPMDTDPRRQGFTLQGTPEDIQAGLAMSGWGKKVNDKWYPDMEYIGYASKNGSAFKEMQESVDAAKFDRGIYSEMVQRSEQQRIAREQQQAEWNQQTWAASQQRDLQRQQQQALIRQREQQRTANLYANTTINYGGTTMTFNGTDWVRKDEVNGIVNTAVNSSVNRMTHSASTRLSMGLT